MKDIFIAKPIVGAEEKAGVNKVLDSGILAQGPVVAELEAAFAKYAGVKHAIAVNSGTAAIHTALYMVGVGAGDEVITTPFTFIATANPVLMQGAIVKFVDIKDDDFNIDPVAVEKAITKKTKAIIGVDLYGQPYDYTELRKIADKHNLFLIEDACQAVGAKYGKRVAGNLGDVGAFSFYATKNLMCGEGGMITTNNAEFADRARRFRQHGMGGPYQYADIGYNYRMTDLVASIALAQLKKIDKLNQIRQQNAELLNTGLAGIGGIITPRVSKGRTHVYHQYTIRVTKDFKLSRDQLLEALVAQGIKAGVYYPKPLSHYPHLTGGKPSSKTYKVAEQVASEAISLPVHPKVMKGDISRIVKAIKGATNG